MEKNIRSYAINSLRKASLRWYGRNNAMKRSKLARNQYECAHCHKIFGRKDIQLDHKLPVIDPVAGFVNFDEYIVRLFVPEEGYQVLCKAVCHASKTAWENTVRVANKKEDVEKKPKKKTRKNP